MEICRLHSFTLKPPQILRLQKKLAEQLEFISYNKTLKIIAGCDVSYCKKRDLFFGCTAIVSYPDWKIMELIYHKTASSFPYIPGMLSFRELPVLLEMFKRIKKNPDLILVDGQGIAHPRGLGLASHLGLFIEVPTIGIAKKRLCGDYDEKDLQTGKWQPLFYQNKQVGYVIKQKRKYRPLFISPGNNIDLISVQKLMQKIFSHSPYKAPHPLYLAHKFSYDFNQYSR